MMVALGKLSSPSYKLRLDIPATVSKDADPFPSLKTEFETTILSTVFSAIDFL